MNRLEQKNGKTRKLVSLFVAAALVVAPGCGSSRQASAGECWDDNNDGRCDDDGSYVSGNGYYYSNGKKRYYKSGVTSSSGSSYKSSSGVSTGSKGGIGSSGSSGS